MRRAFASAFANEHDDHDWDGERSQKPEAAEADPQRGQGEHDDHHQPRHKAVQKDMAEDRSRVIRRVRVRAPLSQAEQARGRLRRSLRRTARGDPPHPGRTTVGGGEVVFERA